MLDLDADEGQTTRTFKDVIGSRALTPRFHTIIDLCLVGVPKNSLPCPKNERRTESSMMWKEFQVSTVSHTTTTPEMHDS